MNVAELKDAIFSILLEVQGLHPVSGPHRLGPSGQDEIPEAIARTNEFVEQLINEAYQNGFIEPPAFDLKTTDLFGGAVAQRVGRATSTTDFAFKADNSPDLLRQAETLRLLREGQIIPREFRKHFPRVYSILPLGPPFAYLMEFFGDGYTRLSDYLFRGINPSTIEAVLNPLVGKIFELFGIRHEVLLPDPKAIYIDRVVDRLRRAATLNPKFRAIATSARIAINSAEYSSYGSYLDAIIPKISSFQPPFSSFVHGDPHPGNIFFKGEGGGIEIRLIDPKPWIWGDYMFDVWKLLHYTMVTGPREDSDSVDLRISENDTPPKVQYEIHRSGRAQAAVEIIRSRLQEFSSAHGDASYQRRLDLSLASNLLGLTENRLNREPPLEDAAILYYCAGLRYLKQAAEGL